MLVLYHFPLAICAQKNRVCLAEKSLHWEGRDASRILRTPEYLKLNPGGYAPTLLHDDRVVTESRIISEYIDETFDGEPLQPEEPYSRAIMRKWTKQIDDSLHAAVFPLTFVPFLRDRILAASEEDRNKELPLDPTKRERTVNLLQLGWDSPHIPLAIQRFEKLMDDMEATLCESKWLAGDRYTLADADFTPYFQRLTDLGMDWLWEDKPAVRDWFTAVRARPSFAAVKKAWFSQAELEKTAAYAKHIGPKFRQAREKALRAPPIHAI